MKLNKKQFINYAFKFTFTFVCLTGLIYQVSLLMDDYLSGKTVVSLNVEFLGIDSLPAFTICTENFLSIEKVINFYPALKPYWLQYMDIYKEVRKIGEKSERGKELIKKTEEIFKNITKTIDFRSISGYEILENLTGNLENQSQGRWLVIILGSGEVNGTLIEINSYIQREVMQYEENYPLESISIDLEQYKCFTSFSYLKQFWRRFKFKSDRIDIYFEPGPYWSPYYLFNVVLFSIHSQNTLPNSNKKNFMTLPTDKVYDIQYNQVQVELLGDGYDTNCYNYDLDYKYANFNMRSDCITNCYQTAMRKLCNLKGFVGSDQMLRRELLRANSDMSITNRYCGGELKTKAECFNECRPDCKYKYYLFEKKEFKWDMGHKLTIDMRHSRVPDVIIKYSAQLSFISFVCNFGGLLSMWLGLSILSIFNSGLELVQNLIVNRKLYLAKLNFKTEVNQNNLINNNLVQIHLNVQPVEPWLINKNKERCRKVHAGFGEVTSIN